MAFFSSSAAILCKGVSGDPVIIVLVMTSAYLARTRLDVFGGRRLIADQSFEPPGVPSLRSKLGAADQKATLLVSGAAIASLGKCL